MNSFPSHLCGSSPIHHGTTATLRYRYCQLSNASSFMFFALLKVHHGLRHLTSWWPTEPSLLSMTDECLLRGKLLMRPYLLGQDTDVCSAACVFTLLHDYCESAGIDATQLLAR